MYVKDRTMDLQYLYTVMWYIGVSIEMPRVGLKIYAKL